MHIKCCMEYVDQSQWHVLTAFPLLEAGARLSWIYVHAAGNLVSGPKFNSVHGGEPTLRVSCHP